MFGIQKGFIFTPENALLSPEMVFHLQNCTSFRNSFYLISRNALILSPEMPCLISKNILSPETFQLTSGNARGISRKVSPFGPDAAETQKFTSFLQDSRG